MKYRNVLCSIVVGTLFGYLGKRLEKKIDKRLKHLKQPEVLSPRGGDDQTGFWLKLLMNHKKNLPWVTGILGVIGTTTVLQSNDVLIEFLSDTTFSSLYSKVNSSNFYIRVLEKRQIVNKLTEVRHLLETFELTPKMTNRERLDGYKLIIVDLLSCDTKRKLIYNVLFLATLLAYLFTGNLYLFTNMIWALIKLIQEGKVSRAVGKTLVLLLRKKGIEIPKELEELVSE
jgi:hypothetical protein